VAGRAARVGAWPPWPSSCCCSPPTSRGKRCGQPLALTLILTLALTLTLTLALALALTLTLTLILTLTFIRSLGYLPALGVVGVVEMLLPGSHMVSVDYR